jgi:hypothetical protein
MKHLITKAPITSWIGCTIKLREEYISLDENSQEYVTIHNALASFLNYEDNISELRFFVQQDVYGVDLFSYRNGKELNVDDAIMTHQIIIECKSKTIFNYPYLWESKYFEIVK